MKYEYTHKLHWPIHANQEYALLLLLAAKLLDGCPPTWRPGEGEIGTILWDRGLCFKIPAVDVPRLSLQSNSHLSNKCLKVCARCALEGPLFQGGLLLRLFLALLSLDNPGWLGDLQVGIELKLLGVGGPVGRGRGSLGRLGLLDRSRGRRLISRGFFNTMSEDRVYIACKRSPMSSES
jgi:hypothetical protein